MNFMLFIQFLQLYLNIISIHSTKAYHGWCSLSSSFLENPMRKNKTKDIYNDLIEGH